MTTALAKAKYSSREIIAKAKKWIAEQYDDEEIRDISLEEVLLDEDVWKITIGFYRKRSAAPTNSLGLSFSPVAASYASAMKVVSISDVSGDIIGMQDRMVD